MTNEISNFQGINTAENLMDPTREWHRGCAIPVAGLSIDEQLRQARLDWEVLTTGFRYGDKYQYRETNAQAAFRSDTGMFLDIYTDRKPWQNREIVEHFHHFCEESDMGLEVSHIGSLKDGKILMAAAKLPIVTEIAKVHDITEWWLLLKDSHLNGNGLQVSLYCNRMVCTNGMHDLVRVNNKVMAHTGEFDRDRVSEVLNAAIDRLRKKEERHQRLAKTTIGIEEATLQLLTAFGDPTKQMDEQPKLIQTAIRLFQGQAKGSHLLSAYNTAYGLLQAVTEYYNWLAPARGDASTQFNSVLSGQRATKMAAFERQLVSVYCDA